ncbi:segregation/condensation protein A [Methanosarcina sp. KYL-1]|uniref:segregation/condensation protein A n=1 Tax=Methanosarcina sp. KYL-1 TaxID=2602068 RepID=UPI002101661F|nr:ScpA family protein [Methanosarcina sp. KYL-1]MCQ1534122.1 segregation/condensation protein A [Methanosarcina sp. KYL-1]
MGELAENAGTALEVPGLPAPEVSEVGDGDSLFPDPESYGLPATLSSLGVEWGLLELSEFETYEPLGILVELAKDGRIDPWDIDIVELTDGFLRRVEELKKMDLRISSRTLLYSAILLRMKSSCILEEDGEEELEDDSGFFDDENFPEPDEFPIPKLPVRRVSTRPVTLNELILELKKAEKALSRKNDKKARQASDEAPAPKGPVLNTGDVLGIAHEEAIGSRLSLIWARLAEMFEKYPHVVFSDFLEGSEDRIMDYLSLLFLASSKKIWLWQKELFGELYIYPGEESGFSTEGNPSLFHELRLRPEEEVSEHGVSEHGVSEHEVTGSADAKFAGKGLLDEAPEGSGPAEAVSIELKSVEANPFEE